MSDLILRSEKAKIATRDLSFPRWQRLGRALEAFSGLELMGIHKEVLKPFETEFVSVNRVLTRYPLTTSEDYRMISNTDLQEMLDTVERASSQWKEVQKMLRSSG